MISLGQLRSLYLFDNSLGSKGFMALTPALRRQHSLLELDLGGNGADEASVVALLNALTTEPVQGDGRNEGGNAVERIVIRFNKFTLNWTLLGTKGTASISMSQC